MQKMHKNMHQIQIKVRHKTTPKVPGMKFYMFMHSKDACELTDTETDVRDR